jgi:hypothetical protein
MNWIHVLHVLIHTYNIGMAHHWSAHRLYGAYVHRHAVEFLRSGITSESPGTRAQAVSLLHWLTGHRVNPSDW